MNLRATFRAFWTRHQTHRPAGNGRRYRPGLERLEDRTAPAVNWIGGNGFWDVATNWSTGAVPTAADDVVISQAGPITVTVRDARAVHSLTTAAGNGLALAAGGALTDAAASVLNGGLTLTGGSLTDNGLLTLGGSSLWSSGTLTDAGGLTNTGTLTLAAGTAMALGGAVTNSGIIVHTGAGNLQLTGTLTNQAGGVYDLQSTAGISGGTFSNAGVLKKSAGGGTATVSSTLDNPGTVLVQSGTFTFSGTVNQVSGTTLTGGTWDVVNGTLNLATAPNLTVNQATVILDGAAAAFARFNTVTTNAGALTLRNGNSFSVTGNFTNSGTLLAGVGGGALNLSNLNFTNLAGGLLDLGSDTALTTTDTTVTNAGTIRKSGGAATLTILGSFVNNQGTIDVQSGTLTPKRASIFDSETWNGGTFIVAAGATLDFSQVNAGTTWKGAFTGSGGGQVLLGGTGVISIDPAGATFNFPVGLFQWASGTIDGSTLSNSGSLTLSGATAKALGANLVNNGTITDVGPGDLTGSGTLTNTAAGLLDLAGDVRVGPGTLINAGTIRKSAGAGTATMVGSITNTGGTFDVQAGTVGFQPVFLSAGVFNGGTFNVANGATLDFSGLTSATDFRGTFTGTGTGTGRVLLAGGNLAVNAAGATFNFPAGLFQWAGGTISGGTLTNLGFLTVSGSGAATLTATLDNQATVTQIGTSVFQNVGKFVNEVTGLYDLQSTNATPITNGGNNATDFVNFGTFRKSGAGSAAIVDPFKNQNGTIDVRAGLLQLANGFSFDFNVLTGGTFLVAPGATLDLSGGLPTTYTGTFTGSGGGTVVTGGGTIDVGAAGAIFNFPGSMLRWDGTLFTGSGSLTNAGTLTLIGAANHVEQVSQFINQGTIFHTGSGNLDLSTFVNQAGALYDLQSDAGFVLAFLHGGTFFNAGTFRKSAGAGTSSLGQNFAHQGGTVDVRSGTLTLAANGTITSPTSTGGQFLVAAGATLNLIGTGFASETYTGAYTGSGAGTVALAQGTITAGAAGASFNFAPGLFQWSGGSLRGGTGPGWTNLGSITVAGAGTPSLGNGTLTNAGTITQTGASTLGVSGVIVNQAGALWDLQTNGGLNGSSTFRNQGTLRKSGGAGTSTIACPLDSSGTVEVDQGILHFTAAVTQVAGGTLTAGVWDLFNGATLTLAGGALATNAATVLLSGPGATFTNLAGNLTTNSGNLTVTAGAALTTGTNLTNSGVLTVGTSATAAGTVTVPGAFTQTAVGTLAEQLGGAPASNLFGKLNAGSANLNGTLAGSLVNGFGATVGQSFQVMTFPGGHTGDFATLIGLAPFLTEVLNPFNLLLNTVATAPDLAVTAITPPAAAAAGQNVTITWAVANLGGTPVAGAWNDSVYLSADGVLDPGDTLVGRVSQAGVGALGGYTGTFTGPLPGVLEGSYHVLVVADSGLQVADADRANNTLSAAGTLTVAVPLLALNGSVSGAVAAGQDRFFRLDVPAGHDVDLSGLFAGAGAAELLVSYQAIPTRAAADLAAFDPAAPRQRLTLHATQAGSYYVLVHGREGAGAGQTFTLSAQDQTLTITGFTPDHGADLGPVTMTVTGTHFTARTAASLIGADGVAHAGKVTVFDGGTLSAAFNLAGLGRGNYTLRLTDGGQTAAAATPFRVAAGLPGRVEVFLSVPATFRVGQDVPVTVTYVNAGDTDVAAPLLEIEADAGQLRLAGQASFAGWSLYFLGTNPVGDAGVLAPGARGAAQFVFRSVPGPTHFEVDAVNPTQFMNWDGAKDALRPAAIDPVAWEAIYRNFRNRVGDTMTTYQAALDEDASYLASLGEPTQDVSRLLRFELERAGGFGAIARRYRTGAFGVGSPDPLTNFAAAAADGSVTVHLAGGLRRFTPAAGGGFTAPPGDTGALRQAGGAFQLVELDGTLTQFRADGKLDFIRDANGNRLTAGYDGAGRLITLTDAFGNTVTYAYNARNFVSQMTDAVGRVTTFTYDFRDRLAGVSNATGTIRYGYITDPNLAVNNALQQITFADGTTRFFVYDVFGRLIESYGDRAAQRIGYTYDLAPGQIQVNNALGDTVTFFLDDSENVARLIDPLGNVYQGAFDAHHNLVGLALPENLTATLQRNGLGDPTQAVTPQGEVTRFTFGALNSPTGLTTPAGNPYANSFDAAGNLLRSAYPDGSAFQYTYSPAGQVQTVTNRAGQTATFAYNPDGTLRQQTVPGVGAYAYTYDAHRNLLTITDPTGVTAFGYDAADRVTSVSYPTGQTLAISYDPVSGRRTRLADLTSGYAVNYAYTALGQLERLTDGNGGLIVKYAYDDAGRVVRQDLGNGAFSTFRYDARGQLLRRNNVAADGATVLSSYAYTYDALGRPVTETTAAGVTAYGYDAGGQLIAVDLPGGRSIRYRYDADGNRTRVIDSAVGATAYAANDLDQYTAVGGQALAYDANGNLIADGAGAYSYDALGRLVGATTPGHVFTYSYNALGQRVGMTDNGTATTFVLDPLTGAVFGEYGGQVTHNVFGLGLASRVGPGGASFYTFDGAGNTSERTDAAGAVLNSYTYLPFGEALTAAGAAGNPFTYNGALGVSSRGDGLAFMTNRAYAPALGRFTSPDPLGFGGGDTNVYRYVNNSPVLDTDPSGLWRLKENVPALTGTTGQILAGGDLGQAGGLGGGEPVLSGNQAQTVDGTVAGDGGAPAAGGDVQGFSLKNSTVLRFSGSGQTQAYQAKELSKLLYGDPTTITGNVLGYDVKELKPVLSGSPDDVLGGMGVPDPRFGSGDGTDDGFLSGEPDDDPLATAPMPNLDACELPAGAAVANVPTIAPADPEPVLGPGDAAAANGSVIHHDPNSGAATGVQFGIGPTLTGGSNSLGFRPSNDPAAPEVRFTPQAGAASGTAEFKDGQGGVQVFTQSGVTQRLDGPGAPVTLLSGASVTLTKDASGQFAPAVSNGTLAEARPIPDPSGQGTNFLVRLTNGESFVVDRSGTLLFGAEPDSLGSSRQLPNGDTAVTFPGGAVKTVSAAGGGASFDFGNGFAVHVSAPDATGGVPVVDAVTTPDPAVGTVSVQLGSDGSREAVGVNQALPNGSGRNFRTDGTFGVTSPNGNSVTNFADGAQQRSDPRTGNTTTTTPGGGVTIVTGQGTTIERPPGSATTKVTPKSGTPVFINNENGRPINGGVVPPDAQQALGGNGAGPSCPPAAAGAGTGVQVHDPNAIVGPAGVGPQRFVAVGQEQGYTVFFENQPTATAAAQVVTITEHLDPGLDFRTFELTALGFGAFTISVPAGRSSFHTRVDARAAVGLFVDLDAGLDVGTGVLTVTFTAIDPATLDRPTGFAAAGFLPPEDGTGRGDGFVGYLVRPNAADPTGAVLSARASIVFDANAPIVTDAFTNTIDAARPTGGVQALPATLRGTAIPVSWGGGDEAGGSGLAAFDVYYSDNGSAFVPFLLATTQTSATFTGVFGHTYAFLSEARDQVGHRQLAAAGAQATVALLPPVPPSFVTARVSATAAGTVLVISGDNGANDLIINQTGPDRFQVLTGPSGTSRVNGLVGSQTFTGVVSLVVNLAGGDDSVTVNSTGQPFTLRGNLILAGTSGAKAVTVNHARIGNALQIAAGALTTRVDVSLTGVTVAGALTVATPAQVAANLALAQVTVGGPTLILTGTGQDGVSLTNGTFRGGFFVNTGAGDDTVAIEANGGGATTFFGPVAVGLAAGRNLLHLAPAGGGTVAFRGPAVNWAALFPVAQGFRFAQGSVGPAFFAAALGGNGERRSDPRLVTGQPLFSGL